MTIVPPSIVSGGATYAHGHPECFLRSQSWRTAQNSASYLLGHIKPDMHILDVGCGPGTITASLAHLVPQGSVTGIEYVTGNSDVLEKARKYATAQGVFNVSFAHGDICNLSGIPDNTYDIVHCHQVLQHVGNLVQALKEMKRVAKPGGIVAAREGDSKAFAWFPETDMMEEWVELYQNVARANRTEPDAGRRLVSWALTAGFDRSKIDATAGTWCFSSPEERKWWCDIWADRTVSSTFSMNAISKGLATRETLERISNHWREWATREDGWFVVLHSEIVCRA